MVSRCCVFDTDGYAKEVVFANNTLASIVPPGSAAFIPLITVLMHFASSVVLGVLAGAEAILDAECSEV